MAKSESLRPAYTQSVGELIRARVTVTACCTACAAWRTIDLTPIAAAKGLDFDLWDRSVPCRLTPGCTGRNRFRFNGRGRSEPMWG